MINRREALARLTAMTGATLIGAEFFLSGCARTDKVNVQPFTPEDIALLDDIADTIIPATDTPGAKAAGVGAFMAMMVTDCYTDEAHALFHEGMRTIEKSSNKAHSRKFAELSAADRHTLLSGIDAEHQAYMKKRARHEPVHYFRLMKDLTLLGYFSSEIGCTKALRYEEAPGAYNGNLPYARGDKAWFNPTRRVST